MTGSELGVLERAAGQMLSIIRHMVASSALPGDLHARATCYLLVNAANMSGAIVARAAGISRQRVSAMLSKVEDRRQGDALVDVELARLEALLFDPANGREML